MVCSKCEESVDCYEGQEYCAVNYKHEESATGRMVLDQQIREELVYEKYPD